MHRLFDMDFICLGEDPFLSPAVAPESILRQFPPVRIIVGDLDPLLGNKILCINVSSLSSHVVYFKLCLDDSVFFYRRLKALNRDVQINVQEGYGHGFLNLVYLIPEVKKSIELMSIWLLKLFEEESTASTSNASAI
jgi:hormone-sensitive lipase